MAPLRIMIADDHTVLRSGLKLLLDSQADFQVVAEASDRKSTLEAFEKHLPEILIVDLAMPGVEGFELLHQLKKRSPSTRLVVLTMHDGPAYFEAAVKAGADAFVPKNAADSELMFAIRESETGKFYGSVDGHDRRSNLSSTIHQATSPIAIQGLSQRELDVLIGVGKGKTNQQMADEMGLSVKSIESYRSRLMLKLGVSARSELVKIALDHGLVFANHENPIKDDPS